MSSGGEARRRGDLALGLLVGKLALDAEQELLVEYGQDALQHGDRRDVVAAFGRGQRTAATWPLLWWASGPRSPRRQANLWWWAPSSSIAPSARKHGVSDDDIRHAYAHPIRIFDLDEGFTMLIGANRAAIILEIGVIGGAPAPVVVHAMRARETFLR